MTNMDTEDDREHAFEAAVCRLEADAQVPLLRRLIDRRGVLERLRDRRVGWPEIAELLAGVGIEISAGGLRNYASRIRLAVAALEAAGENDPNGDSIYAVCRARARPETFTSRQPARASPVVRKPDNRRGQPGPIHDARTSMTRNPDQEL